jgi:hypothetical protein
MSDEYDGWNPLLHLEECDRTFREVALELKANGRLPDPREVAESVCHLAKRAIRAKTPERWARDALTTLLPRKKRGRPAIGRESDVKALAELIRPKHETADAAHAMSELRMRRPWNPRIVRELVELVRPYADDQGQALRWVGAYLGGLSESQVKRLYRGGASEPWPIDPNSIYLEDLKT